MPTLPRKCRETAPATTPRAYQPGGRRGRSRTLAGVTSAALVALLTVLAPGLAEVVHAAEVVEAGQEMPPAQAPEFAGEVAVSWLLVPLVVRNEGGYVDDLQPRELRLRVDGKVVPIGELDRGSDAPLSMVVLQDLSGSMGNPRKLDASRRATGRLLEALRPNDEMALATFAGDRLQVEVPFTDDPEALAEAVASWEGYGTTALHDAVSRLPSISAGGRYGQRAAVLVTDGQDNASQLTPEQARTLVRRADLPVYVIGLTTRTDAGGGDDGTFRYSDLLADLAQTTGGRYFEASVGRDGEEDLEAAIRSILDDLRRRYVLALTTAAEGPIAYRKLEVEVLRRGRYTLTHRRGYTGRPVGE